MIRRSSVASLVADLRSTITDHTPHSDKLDGLHGREFVSRVTLLLEARSARKTGQVIDGKTDLQWMKKDLFPRYLEGCDALADSSQAAPAVPTPEQAAIFRKIGALASPKADAGEVILAAACYLVEMLPGDGWEHRVNDLNAMLRKFAKKRTVPENRFWVNDEQPAVAAAPTKSLKVGGKREAA